jgi:hypothetical protein
MWERSVIKKHLPQFLAQLTAAFVLLKGKLQKNQL